MNEAARREMREWAADLEALRPHVGTAGDTPAKRAWNAVREQFMRACDRYAKALEEHVDG